MKAVHVGDQLDQYRIDHLVARSGMASIFRATDLQTGQPVAIKIPHPEMEADPVLFERFQREAEIGQKLDHPGVMKVLAYNTRRQVYMVMEWVEGRLLRIVLHAQKRLPIERAIKIAASICDILDYCHRNGVVHRDLSPENILLQPGSEGPEPKIIDFGIARAVFAQGDAEGNDANLTLTRVGGFVGKPRYASPEQAGRLKRGEKIDPRSDLYTFGLILYEMVTADLPFHSDSEIGYLSLHHSGLPERPSVLRPELAIPIAMERLILRCREKDREKRVQSAGELGTALAAVQAGVPVVETRAVSQEASAPTGAITLPTQLMKFKNAPSGWVPFRPEQSRCFAALPRGSVLIPSAPPG
jgi:serine/threonine protein kinase